LSPVSANNEYTKRINRVLDYLHENYHQEITLESLADIAHFSKFHFHRIFKSIVGESLYKYILRVRLEKAAHRLRYAKKDSITKVLIDCGFNNSASFARAFKSHFKVSASQYRKTAKPAFSKECKEQSKLWQSTTTSPVYIDDSQVNYQWEITMINRKNINIEVKELKEVTVAYIRNIGPFKGKVELWASNFNKLITWGAARNLIQCPGTQYFTVFRDDFEITDFENFKADLCISVATATKAEGEIGVSTISSGKYAVAQFEIDENEYEQAWELLYREWLPNSGYQPDDRACFEQYLNDPKQHPQQKHFIEICLPVKAI